MSNSSNLENLLNEDKAVIDFCIKENLIYETGFNDSEFLQRMGLIPKVDKISTPKKTWKDIRHSYITPDYCPFRRYYLNNITGPGGTGKSLFALNICVMHILNEKYEHNRDVRCLFWSNEDEGADISDRFKMICQDLLFLTDEEYQLVNKNITFFDNESKMIKIAKKDEKTQGYNITEDFNRLKEISINFDLIILDPLTSFYSECGFQENNNTEAKIFLAPIADWCARMKKTIIMISHSSKGTTNIRGAQAFQDAFRYSVSIHKFEEFVVDPDGKPVKNLSGEVNVREVENKKHLREIRIAKDNSNVVNFLKMNRRAYDFIEYFNDRFSIEIAPEHTPEGLQNTYIPEEDFFSKLNNRKEQRLNSLIGE